jgi:hypothetical protein
MLGSAMGKFGMLSDSQNIHAMSTKDIYNMNNCDSSIIVNLILWIKSTCNCTDAEHILDNSKHLPVELMPYVLTNIRHSNMYIFWTLDIKLQLVVIGVNVRLVACNMTAGAFIKKYAPNYGACILACFKFLRIQRQVITKLE